MTAATRRYEKLTEGNTREQTEHLCLGSTREARGSAFRPCAANVSLSEVVCWSARAVGRLEADQAGSGSHGERHGDVAPDVVGGGVGVHLRVGFGFGLGFGLG